MLRFFFQHLLNLPVIRNEPILNVETKNRNNFGILLVFGKCILMTLNSLVFCFESLRLLWVDFVVSICFWCRFSFYCKYFVESLLLLWIFASVVSLVFYSDFLLLLWVFLSICEFVLVLWVFPFLVGFLLCCEI